MRYGWIATAAFVGMAMPGALSAQNQANTHQANKPDSTASQQVTTTSTGEVGPLDPNVTDAMRKEQRDPNLIGSPAWWSTHATADGKPVSAGRKP